MVSEPICVLTLVLRPAVLARRSVSSPFAKEPAHRERDHAAAPCRQAKTPMPCSPASTAGGHALGSEVPGPPV